MSPQRNDFQAMDGPPTPVQWLSDDRSVTAEGQRDGSVVVRVTIGGTFMGATLDTEQADDLGKFILDVGIWHRWVRANTETPREV